MDSWVYSDKVKEHFLDPKNTLFGDESKFDYDAKGLVGNVICGDQMLMYIKVKDDVIVDIKWKTYGCASAIASTSMLSEVAKGMDIFEAFKLTPKKIADKLDGLPANKFHCSVLGTEALQDAINNYLAKTNREKLKITPKKPLVCPSGKNSSS